MKRFLALLQSVNPEERKLAIDLCLELVAEPEEEFLTVIIALLGAARTEVTITVLDLLNEYKDWLDASLISDSLDQIDDKEEVVRLATFRLRKTINCWPSATTLLASLGDDLAEVRLIASEGLHETFLCESKAFEVAEYLRHDDLRICEAARELLLACGQEDLVKKWMGS